MQVNPYRFLTLSPNRIGRYETPVLTFDQCMDLLDILVSPAAAAFKKKCRDILKRFFAGDESLVDELRGNAESKSLLSEMCRDKLDGGVGGMAGKKHMMEGDDAETRVATKRLNIADMERQTVDFRVQRFNAVLKGASDIATMFLSNSSESDKKWMGEIQQNYAKSCMHSLYGGAYPEGGPSAITAPTYTDDSEPITIALDVLLKNGITDDIDYTRSKAIGKIVARLYRGKYGMDPPARRELVNGVVRECYLYTKCHLPLFDEAYNEYCVSVEDLKLEVKQKKEAKEAKRLRKAQVIKEKEAQKLRKAQAAKEKYDKARRNAPSVADRFKRDSV